MKVCRCGHYLVANRCPLCRPVPKRARWTQRQVDAVGAQIAGAAIAQAVAHGGGEGIGMDVQKAVYEAVGWENAVGWNPGQFVARQMAKLTEEVAEAAACVNKPKGVPGCEAVSEWLVHLDFVGYLARVAFDDGDAWDERGTWRVEKMKAKLEDVLVVLLCAAEALARGTGKPFDIIAGALGKAQADVERSQR